MIILESSSSCCFRNTSRLFFDSTLCGIVFMSFSVASRWFGKTVAKYDMKLLQRHFSAADKHMRISRIISNSGGGSRKEVDKLLKQGKVTVNGKIVRSSGEMVQPSANIHINGVLLTIPSSERPTVIVYNKPTGILSSIGDPWGRPNLSEVYTKYPTELKGLHPVGRLDNDSSGLLLFSNSGDLSAYLLQPTNKVEREYTAVVLGVVDHSNLKAKLNTGVATTDGRIKGLLVNSTELTVEEKMGLFPSGVRIHTSDATSGDSDDNVGGDTTGGAHDNNDSNYGRTVTTVPASVSPASTGAVPDVGDSETQREVLLTGSALSQQPMSAVQLVVTEGKYRMVRRILHNCGHSVVMLRRIRYGQVHLLEAPPSPPLPPAHEEEATEDTTTLVQEALSSDAVVGKKLSQQEAGDDSDGPKSLPEGSIRTLTKDIYSSADSTLERPGNQKSTFPPETRL